MCLNCTTLTRVKNNFVLRFDEDFQRSGSVIENEGLLIKRFDSFDSSESQMAAKFFERFVDETGVPW